MSNLPRNPQDAMREAKKLARRLSKEKTTAEDGRLLDALLSVIADAVTLRGSAEVIYVVEPSALGESLAEHHATGGAQPYRCPKSIYDAVVAVLGKTDRPLSTADLLEEVGRVIGGPPADHQIRVVLRFFQRSEPAMVLRNRARYMPVAPSKFLHDAGDLWSAHRSSKKS